MEATEAAFRAGTERALPKVDLAAAHPYRRAYLPVNRLEDGAMFNW